MNRKKTKIRNLVLISSILLGIFVFGSSIYTDDQEDSIHDDDSLTAAKNGVSLFITQLQGVLIKELREGGPMQAISVCADTAQELTETIGNELGVDIKRISQRVRNSMNTPDEFELTVLESFQILKEVGKEPPYIYSEIREIDDTKELWYFQSLHIQPACIACHGNREQISPEIMEFLKERYPQDKAIGYTPGELRGAVRLKVEIRE